MTVIIFCKTRHYRAAFWVNSQMANQTQKKPLARLKENISVAKEISRHQVLIIPLLFSSQTPVIPLAGVFVSESWLTTPTSCLQQVQSAQRQPKFIYTYTND